MFKTLVFKRAIALEFLTFYSSVKRSFEKHGQLRLVDTVTKVRMTLQFEAITFEYEPFFILYMRTITQQRCFYGGLKLKYWSVSFHLAALRRTYKPDCFRLRLIKLILFTVMDPLIFCCMLCHPIQVTVE